MNNDEVERLYLMAINGNASAQYKVGCLFDRGEEKEDKKNAFGWYKKAANQNHGLATYEVANCYYFGSGVEEDTSEAIEWYQKAVSLLKDSDDKEEQETCGKALYRLGRFFDPHENRYYKSSKELELRAMKMALDAYHASVDRGNGRAAHKLAKLYHRTKPDEAIEFAEKAIAFLKDEVDYLIAANIHNSIREVVLADAYFIKSLLHQGRDENVAIESLGSAANHNHPIACFLGGEMNYKWGEYSNAFECYKRPVEAFEKAVWEDVLKGSDDIDLYCEYVRKCKEKLNEMERS